MKYFSDPAIQTARQIGTMLRKCDNMTIEVILLCDVICLLLIIISIHAFVVYKGVESTFCLFILILK